MFDDMILLLCDNGGGNVLVMFCLFVDDAHTCVMLYIAS